MLRIDDAGNVQFQQDWHHGFVGRGYFRVRKFYPDADMSRIQAAYLNVRSTTSTQILYTMPIAQAGIRWAILVKRGWSHAPMGLRRLLGPFTRKE